MHPLHFSSAVWFNWKVHCHIPAMLDTCQSYFVARTPRTVVSLLRRDSASRPEFIYTSADLLHIYCCQSRDQRGLCGHGPDWFVILGAWLNIWDCTCVVDRFPKFSVVIYKNVKGKVCTFIFSFKYCFINILYIFV